MVGSDITADHAERWPWSAAARGRSHERAAAREQRARENEGDAEAARSHRQKLPGLAVNDSSSRSFPNASDAE